MNLTDTLECFSRSNIRHEIIAGSNEYDEVDDIGILFFLSNISESEQNNDYISEVSNIRIEENFKIKAVVVVDNKRLTYILDIIRFVKSTFSDYEFKFYYQATGKNNLSTSRLNYGSILPIEYLTSSIIPIRIQHKDNHKEICLLLFTLDNFDKDDFKQLVGLAQELTGSWASKSYICFPDYDNLMNQEDVRIIKSHFSIDSFTKSVYVLNYNKPYQNI